MGEKRERPNRYGRIKELRKDNNLTQKEVAEILNMSQTGYSKYEVGENDVPTAILIKLANYYNTSVDYILGISDVVSTNKRQDKKLKKLVSELNEIYNKKSQ